MPNRIQHHYYPVTNQVVSFDGSVATAAAVGAYIQVVRLVSTQPCHVVFAKTPTAATTDMLLPANEAELFTIHPGQKVAAIKVAGGTAGILTVTEMTQ